MQSINSSMSYTEATIREAMRFHTLIPSGITHTVMEDTEFMGYDIPKVSTHLLVDHIPISNYIFSFSPGNIRDDRILLVASRHIGMGWSSVVSARTIPGWTRKIVLEQRQIGSFQCWTSLVRWWNIRPEFSVSIDYRADAEFHRYGAGWREDSRAARVTQWHFLHVTRFLV